MKKAIYFKNNLKIILETDTRIPLVTYFLKVADTGALNEGKYLGSGISHFLEHAVFLGSKNFPEKDAFSNFLERKGALDLNAYTTYDYTAYYFSVFSKYFSETFSNFFDFILKALLDPKKVEEERGTILAEMDIGEDSYDDYFYRYLNFILEKNNKKKYPIIGVKKRFQTITPDDLKLFYQEKYRLKNMTLSLVGNIQESEVIQVVENTFPSLKKKRPIFQAKRKKNYQKYPPTLFQQKEVFETTHQQVIFPKVCLAFSGVSFFDENKYTLEIINYLLGEGKGSVFNQVIKEEKKLVETIVSDFNYNHSDGKFFIYFTLKEQKKNTSLQRKTNNVIQAITNLFYHIEKYLSDKKLQGAISALVNEKIESQESFMEMAYNNLYSWENTDQLNYQDTYLEKIKRLTLKDITSAIKKFFLKENYKLFLLLPSANFTQGKIYQKASRLARNHEIEKKLFQNIKNDVHLKIKKTLIKNESPTKLTTKEKKIANRKSYLKKEVLKNHLKFLSQKSNYPLISASLQIIGGQEFEESSTQKSTTPNGIFNLLAKMLFTSNNSYSKTRLIDTIRENALQFFSHSGENSLNIGFTCQAEKYPLALEILQSIIHNKGFNEKDFALEKKQQLFQIARNKERAESLAVLAFKKKIFKNLAYRYPKIGTTKSLRGITLNKMDSLLQKTKQSKKVYSVIGKVEKFSNQTKGFLETLGSQEIFKKNEIVIPSLSYTGKKSIHFDYNRNINQTHVHMGYFAPPRFSEDFLIFKVIENYLSGLGGPLFQLRSEGYLKNGQQQGGRAYSLGGYYKVARDYGALIFYASLGQKSKDEYLWVIEAFQKEVAKLKNQMISSLELKRAQNTIMVGAYKSQLKNSYQANLSAFYELYDKPYNKWEKELKNLTQITPDKIQKVINQYFKEDNFLVHVMISCK